MGNDGVLTPSSSVVATTNIGATRLSARLNIVWHRQYEKDPSSTTQGRTTIKPRVPIVAMEFPNGRNFLGADETDIDYSFTTQPAPRYIKVGYQVATYVTGVGGGATGFLPAGPSAWAGTALAALSIYLSNNPPQEDYREGRNNLELFRRSLDADLRPRVGEPRVIFPAFIVTNIKNARGANRESLINEAWLSGHMTGIGILRYPYTPFYSFMGLMPRRLRRYFRGASLC